MDGSARKKYLMQEDFDLGINPTALGDTEARLLTLLLTLLKHPTGLNLKRLRTVMPSYYSNENEESDQKKVRRDIEELTQMGFPAHYDRSGKTYRILCDTPESKLRFQPPELSVISHALLHSTPDGSHYSPEVYSLCQKIFENNLSLYPSGKPQYAQQSTTEDWMDTILFCIKSRVPMRMQYERTYGKPREKDIDPIRIIRKNSVDFYLHAYDRKAQEYRFYLIPCIRKIQKLDGEFAKDHHAKSLGSASLPSSRRSLSNTSDNLHYINLHPLGFPIQEEITIEMAIDLDCTERWQNYLKGYPHLLSENHLSIHTTNPQAIFPFLIANLDAWEKLEPDSLQVAYRDFLKTIHELHAIPFHHKI